jgi:FAD:protein FMN transferase
MTRRCTRRTFLTIAAGAAGAAAAAPLIRRQGAAEEAAVLSGPTMGTTYRVTIPRLPAGATAGAIGREVRQLLERIDATMSTYRADSDVSRVNRAASGEWVPVSADTASVAAAAIAMAKLTDGAFDPTIGPLVDLWGFGPAGPSVRMPDAHAIAATRDRIGYALLEVRHDPPRVRKQRHGVRIDLSGIAEGFAVDGIADTLDRYGISDSLIELGGEMRCRGRHPAGRPWTIAIEAPALAATQAHMYVEPADAAIATSGDYRKFFMADGRRYSHVIDPRTGRPVDHRLASVTVIGGSALPADALATALLVMGPEAGWAFAEERHMAALFITRYESGFTDRITTPFARTCRKEPA